MFKYVSEQDEKNIPLAQLVKAIGSTVKKVKTVMANLNIDLPITSKKAQALTLILNPAELVKIILGQVVSPVIEKIEEEPSASADVHILPAPKKRISRKKAAEDSILEEVIAERDSLRQQLADLQTQYVLC